VARTFAEALCERFGCAPEDYLRVALKHSLYPQARVLLRVFPSFARAEDIALLEAAGRVTSEEELGELMREYWVQLHLHGGLLARRCKLRVSGHRLLRLFALVRSVE
jgi:hypothetical protein